MRVPNKCTKRILIYFSISYDFYFQKECLYVKILLNRDAYISHGTPRGRLKNNIGSKISNKIFN